MKILHTIFSLSSGGAERFVVDLCNQQVSLSENEVVLVTINKGGNSFYYLPELSDKVKFHNLGLDNGLSIKSIIGLLRIIRKENPDIVHCHCNLLLIYLPALLHRKSKYIHTLHSLAHFCMGFKWQFPINKFLYKNFVQAVTISKECLQSYINLYNYDNSALIINGREPLHKTTEFDKVKSYINKIKTIDTTPVFIHVARKHTVKNQDLLFSVFDRLERENYDFLLLVIGWGHEDRAKKYAVNKHIHILGELKNIGDYMICSDYFVLTSTIEGLPLTLLEAMSMGVTPICTPAGGIVDVIEDSVNGYIMKGFTEEELYEKIKYVITSKKKIPVDVIKQDFYNKYSMEICAKKYYQLYNNLLSN